MNTSALRFVVVWVCVAALAALSTCACGQPSGPVRFTWEGSDEGLSRARAAAAQWTDVCGVELDVSREPGGAPALETDGFPEGGRDSAFVRMRNGRPTVLMIMRGEDETTWAHELGHALGIAAHADDGVMAPARVRGGPQLVTADDCGRLP